MPLSCYLFLCLVIVAIATVSSLTTSRFLSNTRATSAITTRSSSFNLNADLFKDIEDEEELTSFKRIVTSYLSAKFKECRGEDCKYTREKSEVADLLKIVLPPVSKEELEKEVEVVISKMGPGDVVLENDYVQAVLENSYWADAGHFVVKELIFLDCLNNFYQDKETNNLLGDEDYDELKEQLSWDGSVAASLNALEARFISAVAASRRGNSIVSDEEYAKLKGELQAQKSWVVLREQDPLEKLGVKTFMGYLHRSF